SLVFTTFSNQSVSQSLYCIGKTGSMESAFRRPCANSCLRPSSAFHCHLVEAVHDLVLVRQQPVDAGFVVHRLVDRFGGRFAVGPKQDVEVNLFRQDGGVEPDGDDDTEVVRLRLGNVAGSDRIQNAVGDGGLDGAHQNVRVLGAFDGDFADHQSH